MARWPPPPGEGGAGSLQPPQTSCRAGMAKCIQEQGETTAASASQTRRGLRPPVGRPAASTQAETEGIAARQQTWRAEIPSPLLAQRLGTALAAQILQGLLLLEAGSGPASGQGIGAIQQPAIGRHRRGGRAARGLKLRPAPPTTWLERERPRSVETCQRSRAAPSAWRRLGPSA